MEIHASLPQVPTTTAKRSTTIETDKYNRQRNPSDRYIQERCPFWEQVGACRHGSKCVRSHDRPIRSKIVVFWKLFPNPVRTYYKRKYEKLGLDVSNKKDVEPGSFVVNDIEIDENALQNLADQIYQDLFVELSLTYGEIDNIVICGNYNTHLGGNILVKFKDERNAMKCYQECNDRWFNEKPIFCELSPVSYFDDATCKEFMTSKKCNRGDQCNLIHPRQPNSELQSRLFASQRDHYKDFD